MKQLLLLLTVFAISLSSNAQMENDWNDSINSNDQKKPVNDRSTQQRRFHQFEQQNNSFNNNTDKRSRRLSNYQFNQELQFVKSQPSSNGKRMAARRLADRYSLTSNQVYYLCRAISSYARLDLAKYCYSRCLDPQNYDVVFDALPNMQIADQLDEYITYVNGGFYDDIDDPYDPYGNHNQQCYPMSSQNFKDVKQTISNSSFENTKLETAKTIIASNYLTTDQVMEICRLFDFENSKLDFAKFAYNRTIDKSNFYRVSNIFDFDTSRSALNRFLQNAG